MNAAPGEKVLAAELLTCFSAVWVSYVVKNKAAPAPRQVLGIPMAFAGLALVAALGGANAAKVAAALGGLITVILLGAIGSTPGSSALSSTGQPTNAVLSALVQVGEGATSAAGMVA